VTKKIMELMKEERRERREEEGGEFSRAREKWRGESKRSRRRRKLTRC